MVLATLFALTGFPSSAVTGLTIPPIVIQNDNKTREVFASRGGMEGWAKVSFLVGVDGKPKDIVAFDYSGKERYIRSTVRYVNNLTYSPALVDGVPTISANSLFVPNKFSALGYSEDSVTPAFSEEYQQVMTILANPNPDLPAARSLIDELIDDHTKNLNEQAMAAWLESVYYYKAQDFLEYMRQTAITVELNAYTPAIILARSTVNLFDAQLHYGYYYEALATLEKMKYIDGLDLSEEVMEQFLAQAEKKLDSDEALIVSAKLSPLGGWIYQNTLHKFKLTNVNGKIESVQMRCTGYNQTYLNDLQAPIEVPIDAQRCFTLVQGKKGTRFELHKVDEL